MLYLILSIFSSTAIVIIFRLLKNNGVDLTNVIVINYFTATIVGISSGYFSDKLPELSMQEIIRAPWLPFAFCIGVSFVATFYVIGFSTQKAGITKTAIATKMSVVLPILFSIIYYAETISASKIVGILVALVAVLLTVLPNKKSDNESNFILPLILFVGAGILDVLVKYTQEEHLNDNVLPFFSSFLFFISFITAFLVSVFRKNKFSNLFKIKALLFGTMLGIVNWGSIFFLIKALGLSSIDSSIVFGINNVGILLAAVIIGALFFAEKFSVKNYIGVAFSIIAILLLFNVEVIQSFIVKWF